MCSEKKTLIGWRNVCWCYCCCIISCFIKNHLGLTFLVLVYPSCRGKWVIKWVSVCLSLLLFHSSLELLKLIQQSLCILYWVACMPFTALISGCVSCAIRTETHIGTTILCCIILKCIYLMVVTKWVLTLTKYLCICMWMCKLFSWITT